jgi:predicted transcriptional regulator of viral defense system
VRRDVLALLRQLGRPVYSISDLQKVTGLSRASLYVFLTRWVKAGLLARVGVGLYRLSDVPIDLAQLGSRQVFPSYLSFESALARFGILSQVPRGLTFATTRRPRRLRLAAGEIEYRQLKSELFFGYESADGSYVALPEKALLDELYFMSRGRTGIDLNALNLRPLRFKLLWRFARQFPKRVQALARELVNRAGQQ